MSGLKSLAQELPRYGRYGDSIVAHINPQEAALLKALGGSGTINPHTGLPEYWGGLGALNPFNPGSTVGKIVQQVPGVKETQNLATQVFQPIEKAVVQPVSNALVSVDKAVGKAIPGGWGTVGMVAASMIPGMTPAMMAGLGAINGSGVLRRGGNFNLQGAMMGGAMAYGMASLGEYARGAMPTDVTPTVDASGNLTNPAPNVSAPSDAIEALNKSQGWTGPNATNIGSTIPQGAINSANAVTQASIDAASNINPATGVPYAETGSGLVGNAPARSFLETAKDYVTNIPSNVGTSVSNAYDTLTNPETYKQGLSSYGENVSKTGEGIKNLFTGAPGASAAAASNAAAQGITSPLMATGATLYGATGLMALEEQRKYLEQQKAANAITQAEYDNALAEINRSEAVARKAVADNPFNVNPDRTPTPTGTDYRKYGAEENLYERLTGERREYAVGGSVDDESGMDEARGLSQGNMQNGFMGGGIPSYAAGGMPPRFLSGGGDGMSDSIPATIGGKQEARLADGEFVVPADVVSHLGNGSSKAGAKQLYSMMDKVRRARTGTVKQGKQINPRKFLPA